MKLHTEVTGQGPDLVLLHGWAAHSAVWSLIREKLNQHFRVTSIDLPGHGQSEYQPSSLSSLSALATAVLEAAPKNAYWMGWSLGGLVAQQVALLKPSQVTKLILVASTAKFVSSDDWPHAVAAQVFSDFYESLRSDAQASLLRFIALQTRGSQSAGDDARQLKKMLLQPTPNEQALEAGLKILQANDLRSELKNILCPVLLLGGERDTLLPVSALMVMQAMLENAQCDVIAKAGHAPFLSHADDFLNIVNQFLLEVK